MLELEKEVALATKETEKVLKEKVQQDLYNSYTPKKYIRTNNLKDSITSDNTATEGKAYFDTTKLNHTSVVTGQPEKLVPNFLNYGWKHQNWNGGVDYFHERLPVKFIEDTITEMNTKEEYKDLFKFEVVNS